MTVKVALLRGINVSGKNIIKMTDLKSAFEDMGLRRVQTYIQSGNVLFESDAEESPLAGKIEQEIQTRFGISSTVMLRTAAELAQILVDCPYPLNHPDDGKRIQVSLMADIPSPEQIERLSAGVHPPESFEVNRREIYCRLPNGVINSQLAKNLQKLGNQVTSRNWNTMAKLAELAGALQS